MDIFRLAEQQLLNEKKKVNMIDILNYAIKIRKWVDLHGEVTAQKILAGGDVYNYGNRVIVNVKN